MAKVEYWYGADGMKSAMVGLRRAIGQYARSRHLYIGLTGQNPAARFRQHQTWWSEGEKWDRMIVIYKARSFETMCKVEDELIAYAKKCVEARNYQCELWNDHDHRRPRKTGGAEGYWIYVLVARGP